VIYFNKDKILGNKTVQYLGDKLGVCVIEENRGNIISPDVAQVVALAQVNRVYPEFNWVPVGYYSLYGSSNLLNYYAFVFRKSEYKKFITLDSLEQNASKYSDKTSDESDNKYQFNDIASVWTGVSDGQNLIMRFYRGIPEITGKKVEIQKFVENKYGDKTIGNIISDSLASGKFEIVNKSNNKPTGNVISLDYSIVSKDELIKHQEELNTRSLKRYASLSKEKCESYKQALIEREKDLKSQWSRYVK